MINPLTLVQMMRTNPTDLMNSVLNDSQFGRNPIARNTVDMYQKHDAKGLEQLARNLCQERGIDIDEYRKQLGI